MPPYLPELLNHPVVYMVSEESGDYGPAIIGGFATLFGAGLGALLGAKGAYRATSKANYDHVRRAKLEEIFVNSEEIENLTDDFANNLRHSLIRGISIPPHFKTVRDYSIKIRLENLIRKEEFLIKIYVKSKSSIPNEFVKCVKNIIFLADVASYTADEIYGGREDSMEEFDSLVKKIPNLKVELQKIIEAEIRSGAL